MWDRFASSSDVDICELMIRELTRMIHLHSRTSSAATSQALEELFYDAVLCRIQQQHQETLESFTKRFIDG